MTPLCLSGFVRRAMTGFARCKNGASAVEFALVAAPFFFIILALLQMSIFYIAQSGLQSGVLNTAQVLKNNFSTGSAPTLLTASQLKAGVVSAGGGLIANSSTTKVALQQLTSLSGASAPIVDGTVDYGSTTSVLVLRAQAQVLIFAPFFSQLGVVESSALVRRQGT